MSSVRTHAGSIKESDTPQHQHHQRDREPLLPPPRPDITWGPDDAEHRAGQARRLSGDDRWATSQAVADFAVTERVDGPVPLVVATGDDFPDGLSAGPAAGRVNAPVLLVPTDGPTQTQRDWIEANQQQLTGAWIVGGSSAVSDAGEDELAAALDGEPTDPDPSDPDPSDPDQDARIGERLMLATQDEGELEVTVEQVHDPGEPASDFDEPAAGERYVAVELLMRNTGDTTYEDSPRNAGTLIDDADAARSPDLGDVTDCDRFGGSVTISPDDQRRGCLVFELDTDRDPRLLQFTPDSGFGPDTGEWEL